MLAGVALGGRRGGGRGRWGGAAGLATQAAGLARRALLLGLGGGRRWRRALTAAARGGACWAWAARRVRRAWLWLACCAALVAAGRALRGGPRAGSESTHAAGVGVGARRGRAVQAQRRALGLWACWVRRRRRRRALERAVLAVWRWRGDGVGFGAAARDGSCLLVFIYLRLDVMIGWCNVRKRRDARPTSQRNIQCKQTGACRLCQQDL